MAPGGKSAVMGPWYLGVTSPVTEGPEVHEGPQAEVATPHLSRKSLMALRVSERYSL